jgi:hypothetical protein
MEARFDHRDNETASRGTAIIMHPGSFGVSREKVTFDGGADGTITTVKVQTTEQTFKYASVYLPSDPSERVSTIETLIREKWLDKDTTVEGDFNIVSDVTTETKGNAPYPNQGRTSEA